VRASRITLDTGGRARVGARQDHVPIALHHSGVDVEFTEVVDDHADPSVRTAEHVVEEARLAGAEIACQTNHGDRLHTCPSR
jgi:hypothetical protein